LLNEEQQLISITYKFTSRHSLYCERLVLFTDNISQSAVSLYQPNANFEIIRKI